MLPYDVERIRQGLLRVNIPPPGNQIIEDAKGLLADRDALVLQVGDLQNALRAFIRKDKDGHWRIATSGEGLYDHYGKLLEGSEKRNGETNV